jgi:hypothetical protein
MTKYDLRLLTVTGGELAVNYGQLRPITVWTPPWAKEEVLRVREFHANQTPLPAKTIE